MLIYRTPDSHILLGRNFHPAIALLVSKKKQFMFTKDLHIKDDSTVIYHSQKLETTQKGQQPENR